MINKLITICILITLFLAFTSFEGNKKVVIPDDKLSVVLLELGDDKLPHYVDPNVQRYSIQAGEDLIKKGLTKGPGGVDVKQQSKHFVCTSCHNLVKEDPDLSISDPKGRLDYAVKNDLPFLQGTTLYGAVNRLTFYNGDYYKKYGDLVIPANDNIRNAIQLCATECAQGRELDPWELESILAFMWTLELKLSDLTLSEVEYNFISKALNGEADKLEAISLLKSKYLIGSPATFIDPPADRKAIKFQDANLYDGEEIFKRSCLHCHEDQRYSYLLLDDSKMTHKYLKKNAKTYHRNSIYQVIRYGVPSYQWKKSYMPNYTAEKLSNNQLNNLRAYIEYKATK